MPEMTNVEDEWSTLHLPLLVAVHLELRQSRRSIRVSDVSVPGFDQQALTDAAIELEAADYLNGVPVVRGGPAHNFAVRHLEERGLRAVKAWPSEDPFEALIAALQRLEESPDQETATTAKRVRDGFLSAGRDTAVGVMSTLIAAAAGSLG